MILGTGEDGRERFKEQVKKLGAHTKRMCPYENPYVERTLGIRGTYQKNAPLPQNPYVERTFETFGAHK